jgi:hypothetical protein
MTITLAELAAQRRAKLDALNAATPGHLGAFETFDLSALNDAIGRTPIASWLTRLRRSMSFTMRPPRSPTNT